MQTIGRVKTTLAASLLALAATMTSSPAQEPDWEFAGTIEISSKQFAFLVSAKTGGGVLEFEGQEYDFKIKGLGVGGIGVQKVNAVGAVYNMDDVSKFPGRPAVTVMILTP